MWVRSLWQRGEKQLRTILFTKETGLAMLRGRREVLMPSLGVDSLPSEKPANPSFSLMKTKTIPSLHMLSNLTSSHKVPDDRRGQNQITDQLYRKSSSFHLAIMKFLV